MDLAADAQVYASDGIGSKVSVAETVQMQGFPAGGNLTDVSYKREVESSRSEALVLGDVKQTVAIAEKSELDLKVFPLDRIALKERGNVGDVGLKRKTGKDGFMTTVTVSVKGNGIYINHICSLSACLFSLCICDLQLSQVSIFFPSRLLSSLWVSRIASASDWRAI